MMAEIYLVFNDQGQPITTRMITQPEVVFRTIDRAEEFANMSPTLLDLGSVESWSVHVLPDDRPRVMQRYDRYMHYKAVKVAEIDI